VAHELGVAPHSLRRWLARAQAFRPVAIRASVPPPPPNGGGCFVLHTATGHRLEGLTLPDAITVLRALEMRA
jgi:hypothetical protein